MQWQAGKHRWVRDSGFAAAAAPSMSRWSLVGKGRGGWGGQRELKISRRERQRVWEKKLQCWINQHKFGKWSETSSPPKMCISPVLSVLNWTLLYTQTITTEVLVHKWRRPSACCRNNNTKYCWVQSSTGQKCWSRSKTYLGLFFLVTSVKHTTLANQRNKQLWFH